MSILKKSVGVINAILLVLLFIIIQFVMGIPNILLMIKTGVLSTNRTLSIFTLILSLFLFIKIVNWKSKKYSFRDKFIVKANMRSIFLPIALAVVGMGIVLSEFVNLIRVVLPFNDYLTIIFDRMHSAGISTIILIVIVGPIVEEVVYRGIILEGLQRKYKESFSIILSALIFGAIHLNIYQFVPAFVLGLLFGYIYMKTKCLTLCVLGHALNNSMYFIFVHLLSINIEGYTLNGFQPLWFLSIGIVCSIIGGLMILKKLEGKKEEEKAVSEHLVI